MGYPKDLVGSASIGISQPFLAIDGWLKGLDPEFVGVCNFNWSGHGLHNVSSISSGLNQSSIVPIRPPTSLVPPIGPCATRLPTVATMSRASG